MTIAEGLAFTGLVFLVAAFGFGLSNSRQLNTYGWAAFVLAIASWFASIWTGVLT